MLNPLANYQSSFVPPHVLLLFFLFPLLPPPAPHFSIHLLEFFFQNTNQIISVFPKTFQRPPRSQRIQSGVLTMVFKAMTVFLNSAATSLMLTCSKHTGLFAILWICQACIDLRSLHMSFSVCFFLQNLQVKLSFLTTLSHSPTHLFS